MHNIFNSFKILLCWKTWQRGWNQNKMTWNVGKLGVVYMHMCFNTDPIECEVVARETGTLLDCCHLTWCLLVQFLACLIFVLSDNRYSPYDQIWLVYICPLTHCSHFILLIIKLDNIQLSCHHLESDETKQQRPSMLNWDNIGLI